MVTDVSKFLHYSDSRQLNPNLLVSRKGIVAYHTRLEKAGIKASGQQMKLSRIQTAAEFLLLEADGSEAEAELFRRTTLTGRLISTLTSSLGAERSRQQATRLVTYKPPDLDVVSEFIRSGRLTASITLLQQAVQSGGTVDAAEMERAMLVVMGRIAYR